MKLLVGNGIRVEVREVGEVIYEVEAHADAALGFHGFQILEDDEAREILEHLKLFGKGKNLVN